MSHYFPKLSSFQGNFGNFGIKLMKLGLFSCQLKKILKIWPMFIPVFALNKGSSLYQEADFETHFSGTSPDRPLYYEPPRGCVTCIYCGPNVKINTRKMPQGAQRSWTHLFLHQGFACVVYKNLKTQNLSPTWLFMRSRISEISFVYLCAVHISQFALSLSNMFLVRYCTSQKKRAPKIPMNTVLRQNVF